jgi:hypothetical protein
MFMDQPWTWTAGTAFKQHPSRTPIKAANEFTKASRHAETDNIRVDGRLNDKLSIEIVGCSPPSDLDVEFPMVRCALSMIVPGEQTENDIIIERVDVTRDIEAIFSETEAAFRDNFSTPPPPPSKVDPEMESSVFVDPHIAFAVTEIVRARTTP